ncbi:CCD96 protein, partial [Amia calva]|nr:CCD96 protein [Amia calva]
MPHIQETFRSIFLSDNSLCELLIDVRDKAIDSSTSKLKNGLIGCYNRQDSYFFTTIEESEEDKLETVEEGTEPITESDNTDELPKMETPEQTTAEEETDYSDFTQDFTVTDPVPGPRENHVEEAQTVMVEAKEEGLCVNYEEYMERYRELQKEKQKIIQQDYLIHKLEQYLHRKTGEEVRHEREKPFSDQEQRYIKYMAKTPKLVLQHKSESKSFQHQLEKLRAQSQKKVAQVDRKWKGFMDFQNEAAVSCLSRQLRKQAAMRQVEQDQANENYLEKELMHLHPEFIKLIKKTRKIEEKLVRGLDPEDINRLEIENQPYYEKIEERNEELLKVHRKISSTVQVITPTKEKLQFIQVENQAKKAQLTEVEAPVAFKQDILTRTKQASNNLHIDNLKLEQQCGLRGNETLLRDFEEKVDVSEALSQRLEMLKRRHAEDVQVSRRNLSRLNLQAVMLT